MVASARGEHSLDGLQPFKDFVSLDPAAAIGVVRAARLYQQGLWIAESDPNLAWLLLSSAVETAANHWRAIQDEAVDRLHAWNPLLAERLAEVGGPELVVEVADIVAPLTGATKKFIDFMLSFCPNPPIPRPPPAYQLDWTPKGLKAAFNTVYGYRSRALHAGIPFPSPMSWPPHILGDTVAEKLVGAAGTGVNNWLATDLPFYLQTFEYLVRNALLNWWRSLERPI